MLNKDANHVTSQIEKIQSLPAFPLLSNILKSFACADSVGDLRSLTTNLESEPSIAAKVIGVSNSALFPSGTPVNSIKDAVIRLGLVQLKGIVYSILLANRFNTKKCPTFDMPRFWYDSMMLANCAAYVCDHHNGQGQLERNEVYCIGLMLNIGLLAFIYINPAEMNSLFEENSSISLCQRERDQYFGMDHYNAGSVLLKHWSLPSSFYSTLEHFNKPNSIDSNFNESNKQPEDFTAVKLLRVAKILVENDFQPASSGPGESINLSNQDLEEIKQECEDDKAWILSFAAHF